MAETAVNLVIDKLIPLLLNEVRLQRGIHAQVQFIGQELETIQSFLRDADAKAEREDSSNVVKSWVKQVREVAHRMEDVIDEYLLHVAKRRQGKRGFVAFLREVGGLVKSIRPTHEITSEIGEIRREISALRERKVTFESDLSGSNTPGPNTFSSAQDNKLGAYFVEEAHVVGFEIPKQELTHKLLSENTALTVIPVLGTGGLGKTTLVRIIFDDDKVMNCFACKAWVTVSRSFKVEELLRNMIKQFYKKNESAIKGIETMEREELVNKAREYLQRKTYLVVFDDVWATDFWGRVKFAFPSNEEGSRIIITTRNRKVAEFCQGSALVDPYNLKPLEQKQALELFYQKAFQFSGGQCPNELRKLSTDIIHKCGRIPLAIVAIGGLLSSKNNNSSEWQKVHDSLGSKLGNDPLLSSFHQVLLESYLNLPYQLKICLLYFGIFPEDYSISCKRLLRLWIAEGFVEEKADLTVEEVSEEYLTELINRSLVQVSWLDFDGKPRSCRVHDLLHDFILKKCRELNFCQVLKKAGSSSNSTALPRRLSIHDSYNEKGILEGVANHVVRSCFVFSMEELPKRSITTFFSSFRLLKTLDFEDAPLDVLPEEVGNLLHLRYLSVRNTRTKTVPRSIGKLQNLRTLDLKNSQVDELPQEINNLINLRHLLGYSFHEEIDFSLDSLQGVKIKEGFGRLKALRKLYSVDTTHGAAVIKEFKKLRQLWKLGITKLTRKNGRALCGAIENMTDLRSLSIGAAKKHELLDLGSLTHPPEQLQRLYLKGRLENLPIWIPRLRNLVRLHLNWSGLMDDPIVALKDLQELLELGLHNSYDGEALHFKVGWLKKLKILRLKDLQGLKMLTIDEGSLTHLEKLHIGPCPQLAEVPTDIQNLQNLQTLRFYDVPDEFRQSMDPKHGIHFKIVEHVSSVLFFNKRGRGKRYYRNSLHYSDALKNRFGSEDYDVGAFFESLEVDQTRLPEKIEEAFGSKPETTDKWFWATALLFSVFVVILVLLSKFLEQ